MQIAIQLFTLMLQDKLKMGLVTWLLLPAIMVWFSINYLIGLGHRVVWDNGTSNTSTQSGVITNKSVTVPYHWRGEGVVTIWFDDAWASQYVHAAPLLEDHHWLAALAVPTGSVGFDSYMNWNQISLLYQKGWEITSHTVNHNCDSQLMSLEYIDTELKHSREVLNSHGFNVLHFVSPCGVDSDLIKMYAKKYYQTQRLTTEGLNDIPVTDPYALKSYSIQWNTSLSDIKSWLDLASQNHQWLILVFHQIQFQEDKYAVTPEKISQIINLISESGLPVILPSQAVQLIVDAKNNE